MKHTEETKELLRYKAKLQYMAQGTKDGFKKGHIPWNKGIKKVTSPKSKKTQFTSDNSGEKHVSWLGGIQVMNNDCVYLWDGANKRKRRPRKVWEDVHGKIPKGMCIWHIDGNKWNDNINNLELVTRAEIMRRNAPNHTGKDKTS
jgi:hypothetical protein